MSTVEVDRARNRRCFYRIRARNGNILSRSQTYSRPYNARRAALSRARREGHRYRDLTKPTMK